MEVSKESMGKFSIRNQFHVKIRIISPEIVFKYVPRTLTQNIGLLTVQSVTHYLRITFDLV